MYYFGIGRKASRACSDASAGFAGTSKGCHGTEMMHTVPNRVGQLFVTGSQGYWASTRWETSDKMGQATSISIETPRQSRIGPDTAVLLLNIPESSIESLEKSQISR